MSKTRRRSIPDADRLGRGTLESWHEPKINPTLASRFAYSRSVSSFGKLPVNKRGTQVTVSESHNWDGRSNKPSIPGDVGGPFFTQKRMIQAVNGRNQLILRKIQSDQSSQYWFIGRYIGPVLAYPPGGAEYPTSIVSSKQALEAKGTTAIARCKPTNSVADLATALAELYTGGLPRLTGSTLWEKNTLKAKDAGDEYLNQQFGWLPLVSDVRSIAQAVAFSHAILESYERGSKQVVRRRYRFPEESTTTVVPTGAADYFTTSDHPAFRTGTPSSQYLKTTGVKNTWFSGAFSYHLPTGFKSRNAISRLYAKANALLGIELTPEVLWNAAPWSWAVDWFTNAGDLISNFSDWSTDSLVLKYGYVMEHSFATNTYFASGPGRFDDIGVRASAIVASVETKQRIVATPYGFGLSWDSFSPRQLSIISALGLSRSSK